MLFSIIVPVYNVEKYIRECIESIINQTHQEWELILVDDGSTDRSREICHYYAESNDKIKLYAKENSGQADSRNFGITKANGDYMLFVDSDDYIGIHALEWLDTECRKWPQADVVISEGLFEVYGERAIAHHYFHPAEYRGLTGRETLLRTMAIAPNWSPCGKGYKISYWRQHQFAFQSERLAEDFELIDRVVLEAGCVSMIPGFYYYRRFREDSTMTKPNKKLKKDELLNFASWEQYFAKNNITQDTELLCAFRNRFAHSLCHDILASLYLFDKVERKDLLEQINEYLFYLDYSKSGEVKIIRASIKMIGLPATCFVLGKLKQYRIKRERKQALIK